MAHIEVYEWKPGAARPGSDGGRISDHCLDILGVPDQGQIPAKGDIVWFGNGEPWQDSFPYQVIDRELLWMRNRNSDLQEPQKWLKMWIFVRALSESDYAALSDR